MFALHTFQSRLYGRATLQQCLSSSKSVAKIAGIQVGQRRRLRRPEISLKTPRKWNRPLREGMIPAYDEAMRLLRADSAQVKKEAEKVRMQIEEGEARYREALEKEEMKEANRIDVEQEVLRKMLKVLEVQGSVNLPWVRWSVKNAMADTTKTVDRHLLEHKWRKNGDLDLLMERLYQMKVIPDILPELHPGVDFRVTAHVEDYKRPGSLTAKGTIEVPVEPGTFLTSVQVVDKPPRYYAQVFHTDTRLYTLLLVDLDVVDDEKQRFTTFLHWMQPNIPLAATTNSRITHLQNHTQYIPPFIPVGTSYHRLVTLLLPQPPLVGSAYTLNGAARAELGKSTSLHLDIPVVPYEERRGFDARAFIQRWNMSMTGGGAHMWRQNSSIFDEHRGRKYFDGARAPVFSRNVKHDPYAEMKSTKKYVL